MTNQDIDISMDNVVQYANQIRMPLDSWNKETQKQILSVMEAQRIASGLNVTTFYNTLLGSTCSYKTIQHIRKAQSRCRSSWCWRSAMFSTTTFQNSSTFRVKKTEQRDSPITCKLVHPSKLSAHISFITLPQISPILIKKALPLLW